MNRNDLIIAINNLYDENIDLKVANEFLKNKVEDKSKTKMCVEDKSKEINDTLNKLIEYGKNKLFEEVIRNGYGSNINVWEDEETKVIKTTTLEKWLDNKIYSSYIPDNMSKEDVKNILCNEIMELYEQEKSKAIKDFEKKKDVGEKDE